MLRAEADIFRIGSFGSSYGAPHITTEAQETRVRGKRQYSDQDKAVALATLKANGDNVQKTAKILKMPAKTLENWARGQHTNPDVAKISDIKKGELSERLEEVAWSLTENLSIRAESDLSILVPMKDIATSLGIVVDKMQLLKGQPTGINKNLLTDEQKAEKASDIIGRGKMRLVKNA